MLCSLSALHFCFAHERRHEKAKLNYGRMCFQKFCRHVYVQLKLVTQNGACTFLMALHWWDKLCVGSTIADNGKRFRLTNCMMAGEISMPSLCILIMPRLNSLPNYFDDWNEKGTQSSVQQSVTSFKLCCSCHCAFPVPSRKASERGMFYKSAHIYDRPMTIFVFATTLTEHSCYDFNLL